MQFSERPPFPGRPPQADAYIKTIRTLLQKTFDLSEQTLTEQDRAWEDWLTLEKKEREPRDLLAFLKLSVGDAFKARALTMLWVPSLTLAPFAWNAEEKTLRNYLFMEPVKIAELTPPLREYARALLRANIEVVHTFPEISDERLALSPYNRFILQVLALNEGSSSELQGLAERYELRSPLPFESIDDSSGYRAFSALLRAPIPEAWKEATDRRMRAIILEEASGQKPRRDWEAALPEYTRQIQSCFYDKSFPYGFTLFASQIAFVLQLPSRIGQNLFADYHAEKILTRLPGDARKGIRHVFARHLILEDRGKYGGFSIYSAETQQIAQRILKEFGDDAELADRLRQLLTNWKSHQKKAEVENTTKQAEVDSLLARMR